jgi:uncharacterized membrane protein YesL
MSAGRIIIQSIIILISEKGNETMAGIFGFFDFTKPGPGVPDDEPPKAPIVVFFEVLQRKFWELIKINLMFNLFNIPAIILGMFVLLFFFPDLLPNASNDPKLLTSEIILKFILLTILMCVPMITVGPAQAGFSYILRNYSREEHAFVWGDFKETAVKNLKQSTIVCIIDFFATFIMLWSIRAYLILGGNNILMTIGLCFAVIVFLIFMMMHIYIYPMLVTFDLSLKQIYKNSFIFAAIKFLPNLGILLLCALIITFSFGLVISFGQIIGMLFYIFITVSLIGYILNFYAYPKLKRYMIAEEEDEEEDGEDEA